MDLVAIELRMLNVNTEQIYYQIWKDQFTRSGSVYSDHQKISSKKFFTITHPSL